MGLLVITARYPTVDLPAAGIFVRDRLADPSLTANASHRPVTRPPSWLRYLAMLWSALSRGGRFDGVEGTFVLPSDVIALLAARLRGSPLGDELARDSRLGGPAGRVGARHSAWST